jgi:hypothetical protein
MSISNINPNGAKPLGSQIGPRNDVNGQSRLQQQRQVQIPREARDDKPATPAQALRDAVTIAPPPGTDPALWSILTNAEREHFSASGARGPLTYGMASRGQLTTPAPTTARGGRLDVKV